MQNNQVVLIVLFNHKYEKNLPVLRDIYSRRFSNLFFIMPFYTGTDKDVIPVYENSYYFQGYLTQALPRLIQDVFKHYIIIGDDLILNPTINQDNYCSYFNLDESSGFIPDIFMLDVKAKEQRTKKELNWPWNYAAFNFAIEQKGIEITRELPTLIEAEKLFLTHGYRFKSKIAKGNLSYKYPSITDVRNLKHFKIFLHTLLKRLNHNLDIKKSSNNINYPLAGSYCDIIIVPQQTIGDFLHFCGIFAALNLFVEIAMPTAMIFSIKKIVQEKTLEKKGITLWDKEEFSQLELAYNMNLEKLLKDFPEDAIYIHPVKLSRWN